MPAACTSAIHWSRAPADQDDPSPAIGTYEVADAGVADTSSVSAIATRAIAGAGGGTRTGDRGNVAVIGGAPGWAVRVDAAAAVRRGHLSGVSGGVAGRGLTDPAHAPVGQVARSPPADLPGRDEQDDDQQEEERGRGEGAARCRAGCPTGPA